MAKIACLLVAITLVLTFLVGPANALLIEFTNESAFNLAAGPTLPVPLASLAPDLTSFGEVVLCLPSSPFIGKPCSATVDGITFTARRGRRVELDQRPELRVFHSLAGETLISSAAIPLDPNDFSFTFSGHAVGFDISPQAFPGSSVSLQVKEAQGPPTTFSVFAVTGGSFFGFTSDDGFKEFSFSTAANNNFFLSNMSVDELSEPVPEPTTLLLFGTTATGIGLARWRQRRRKQQPEA